MALLLGHIKLRCDLTPRQEEPTDMLLRRRFCPVTAGGTEAAVAWSLCPLVLEDTGNWSTTLASASATAWAEGTTSA